jgi:hypothetical protein
MILIRVYIERCLYCKRADCDPVLPPVTQIYSLLLNQFEKMKEGKNSQKIFEHVMKWSLEQLQSEEKMVEMWTL